MHVHLPDNSQIIVQLHIENHRNISLHQVKWLHQTPSMTIFQVSDAILPVTSSGHHIITGSLESVGKVFDYRSVQIKLCFQCAAADSDPSLCNAGRNAVLAVSFMLFNGRPYLIIQSIEF